VKQAEVYGLDFINTKCSWICSSYCTDREQINPKLFINIYLTVSSYVRYSRICLFWEQDSGNQKQCAIYAKVQTQQ